MLKRARKYAKARFGTQLAALGVLLLPWMNLRGFCSPVFFCHSCPLATMACPLGVLVHFSTLRIVPFITLGILGLVGVIGGRFVCGWLCPFGMLQDWLHKIPGRKFALSHKFDYIKYGVLVVMVLAIPFFLPGKPFTFCHFCPSAMIESTVPWTLMGATTIFDARFYINVAITLGVLGLAMVVSRGFCRTLCPLGAIFGLFNKFSVFRFELTHHKCNGCGVCSKVCPTDIDPVEQMNTAECVRCLDCTGTKHIKIGVK